MGRLIYLVFTIGALATLTLLLGLQDLSAIGMGASVIGALLYLAFKAESSRRKVAHLTGLQDAYDQLDQQAKLIIRTDLELHRTQEELDRQIASLMSLHQLGQRLEVSLALMRCSAKSTRRS